MFAKALRDCLGYGFLAVLLWLTAWSLHTTMPTESFKSAPTSAKVMLMLLALGLDVGFVLCALAAVLAAMWPLLPEEWRETK